MPRTQPRFRPRLGQLDDRLTPTTFDVLGPFTPATAAAQPDGKVIVAGTVPGDYTGVEGARQTDVGVVRLTADGGVDPTFNGGRVLRVRFRPTDTSQVVEAAVGPDGKVTVLATTVETPNMPGFGSQKTAVLRVNPDGTPDGTFGGDGCLVFDLDDPATAFEQRPTGLAVGPDGSVVVVGSQSSIESDFVAVRLTPAGAFDPTFDGDGRARVAVPIDGGRVAIAADVAVLADGRVVIGGTATESAVALTGLDGTFRPLPKFLAVARLTPAGGLDPTFDADGVAVTAFDPAGSSALGSLAVQPDGRIVLAGTDQLFMQTARGFALRLTADGGLDPTFDGDGRVRVPAAAGWGDERVSGVAVRPDGSVAVAGGESRFGDPVPEYRGFVTAFLSDGRPDPGFARATVPTSVIGSAPSPEVAARADGSVVVAVPVGVVPAGGGTFTPLTPPPGEVPIDSGGVLPETVEPAPPPGPVWTPPADFVPFPGFAGPVRAVVADLTADGAAEYVYATGAGDARLSVFDGRTGAAWLADYRPYEATFRGGLFLAAGDLDAFGPAELVVSPDLGGSARVRVLRLASNNGVTGLADFFAIADSNFRGGGSVAVGDFDGDGAADLAVGAGVGGGPRVSTYDGRTVAAGAPRLVSDFFALDDVAFRGGITLTGADFVGDGRSELAVAAGAGGGPLVRVLTADGVRAGRADAVATFFAGDPAGRAGAVTAPGGDADADGRPDLLVWVGQQPSGPSLRFAGPGLDPFLDAGV